MWALSTAQNFLLRAYLDLGRVEDLLRLAPRWLGEAEDRGDSFCASTMRAYIMPWYHLILDDSAGARAAIGKARAALPPGAVQQITARLSELNVTLYEGGIEEARRQVQTEWPAILATPAIARIRVLAIRARELRGRCALAGPSPAP